MPDERSSKRLTAFLLDIRTLQVLAQIVFIVVVVTVFYRLAAEVLDQLAQKNISPTLDFMDDRAGFQLSDAGDYSPDDTYIDAFKVGVINTLRVVTLGLVTTTILGVFGGVLLLSRNWVMRTITRVLVEIIRNTPLLVQLFVWFYVVLLALPVIRESIQIPAEGITPIPLRWLLFLIAIPVIGRVMSRLNDESPWRLFLPIITVVAIIVLEILKVLPMPLLQLELAPIILISNRGLGIPALVAGEQLTTWLAFGAVGLIAAIVVYVYFGRRRAQTGLRYPRGIFTLIILIATLVVGWFISGGAPVTVSLPARAGLRYAGGIILLPEFTALLIGLVVYTAAFIAEIVRAGIQAVPHGQTEAARALGLSPGEVLRLIVLPQALRVIVPPLGNQYLNLAKNSSLAIAISFTDVFQVTGTIINQSGQAVTGILLIMVCYLILSLAIAAGMNVLNRRFQLVTR